MSILFINIIKSYIIILIFINKDNKITNIIIKILIKKINTKENNNIIIDKVLNSNSFIILVNNLKIYIILLIKNKKAKKY